MIIEPKPVHTTVNHARAQTPPDLRQRHEAVLEELARQAGLTWDRGAPPPVPPAPNSK